MIKSTEFQIDWLSKMSFGNAEGERDKMLVDSFTETRSIRELVNGDYNYVLAPKGCGKSSLFKAYENRFLNDDEIKDEYRTIVVPISNMFSYENINLEENQSAKKWAIIWGVYIIKEIFRVITSDKYSYDFDEFIKKNSKYEELKRDFEIYDLWDYIENVNVGFKFSVKGQEVSLAPTISRKKTTKKIVLNEIFSDLQSYLQRENKKIYILIDRIDDFVLGESKESKRDFIQGWSCVKI